MIMVWRPIHSPQQGLQTFAWTSWPRGPPKGGFARPSRSCPHFAQWTVAMPLIPPESRYSSAMLTVLAVAALVAVAFGVYLALLLGSIRKSAYGEGKLLDLPPLGISLRYPAWWT